MTDLEVQGSRRRGRENHGDREEDKKGRRVGQGVAGALDAGQEALEPGFTGCV